LSTAHARHRQKHCLNSRVLFYAQLIKRNRKLIHSYLRLLYTVRKCATLIQELCPSVRLSLFSILAKRL